ncbi:retrovirus-related pol polyprotein from transposon TNT 1-94 [Tanacetum coccineum]
MDKEALKEMLEEEAMNKNAQEEKIRLEQAKNNAFFLEFGIVSLAVLLIGLGGLEFSEFVHDPQHVCSWHHLPLSVIMKSHSLQRRENIVIQILGALCLQYLLEECQFPLLCIVTSFGLSPDVSDAGLLSEKVVASRKNGRYSQWRSRFLRYIDTKRNGEYLRKCIFEGPYKLTSVVIEAVAATVNSREVPEHDEAETVHNMSEENKLYFKAEKEAIFLLLTGIRDEIYSTVDACNTANDMWTAIERLQQGESLNIQDVKTNLFWEFGKFTSRDGESMESYYSRFYKLMNELTRNNLQVTTMQVNVQFLQQLQPEWSRFVTVVKQSKEIDTISYHTLFDILKQYQNEVNDIRAERIAKSANPLALLAAAQPYSNNYYQAPKPQRSNATSFSTRPISEEDSDPEQAQRDKDMQKNLALLAKYFKKLYKPTNNNLRTSSNSRNKTEDTTPRYNNNNQSWQFGNQRTMTVAGARETVGSQVVQQNGIQCFNCKGFGHYAKECRKPKRVKDYTYHKEKMMMCKQAEQGVPLQAEQADWLADTDEEIDE